MSNPEEKINWIEHLEELRRRVFVILAALAGGAVLSYFFSDALLQLLTSPIRPLQEKLYFMTPYEAFLVKLEISFFSGAVVTSPVILTQIWLFVAPGLYEKEKKSLCLGVGWTLFCFFSGIVFSFFAALPFALRFFLGFQTAELKPLISIRQYLSFTFHFLLGFGIAFVFPVFILLLVKLGVVGSCALARQRKLAVVIIFIVAAILTPSPDVISQALLALPLLVLFELSVFLAKKIERAPAEQK